MSIFYPQPANTPDPLSKQIQQSNTGANPLFDMIDLETVVENGLYFSLNSTKKYYGGYLYSEGTTVSAPPPEHPDGTLPSYLLIFGLTAHSLSISGGSGHEVGDKYFLEPLNPREGRSAATIIKVKEVGSNGEVLGWTMQDRGLGWTNSGIGTNVLLRHEDTIKARMKGELPSRVVVPATITYVPDKYKIEEIIVIDSGSGYRKTGPRKLTFTDPLGTGRNALCYATQEIRLSLDITNPMKDGINWDYVEAAISRSVLTHNDYEA